MRLNWQYCRKKGLSGRVLAESLQAISEAKIRSRNWQVNCGVWPKRLP